MFLNRSLFPITSKLAFIDSGVSDIVDDFIKWQAPLVGKHNNSLIRKELNLDFENTLKSLCPLNTVEKRNFLFIPTKPNWTLFLDNGHTGTDRTIPEVLSKHLNTNSIYVCYDNTTVETLFEFYSNGNIVRFIGTIKENNWKFFQIGNPFDFEDLSEFKKRIVKDRFNYVLLKKYLLHFKIDTESSNFFYLDKTILIQKVGLKFEQTKELTIEEAEQYFKK